VAGDKKIKKKWNASMLAGSLIITIPAIAEENLTTQVEQFITTK